MPALPPGCALSVIDVQQAFDDAAWGSRNNPAAETNIGTLAIAGISTDHCVSTTTRMAANAGFETILAGDACATFLRAGPDGRHSSADQMHDSALAGLLFL